MRDRSSLVNDCGTEEGGRLEQEVRDLVHEMGRIDVDWSVHSLASASNMARSIMQARHPTLSESALQALAWDFSFEWR